MSTEDEYKVSETKVPMFDGKMENWPFFRKKMESYLARLNLSEVLTKT